MELSISGFWGTVFQMPVKGWNMYIDTCMVQDVPVEIVMILHMIICMIMSFFAVETETVETTVHLNLMIPVMNTVMKNNII